MSVDRGALRRTIETTPNQLGIAVVTRRWLEEVERDLAELVALRSAKKSMS